MFDIRIILIYKRVEKLAGNVQWVPPQQPNTWGLLHKIAVFRDAMLAPSKL